MECSQVRMRDKLPYIARSVRFVFTHVALHHKLLKCVHGWNSKKGISVSAYLHHFTYTYHSLGITLKQGPFCRQVHVLCTYLHYSHTHALTPNDMYTYPRIYIDTHTLMSLTKEVIVRICTFVRRCTVRREVILQLVNNHTRYIHALTYIERVSSVSTSVLGTHVFVYVRVLRSAALRSITYNA